MINGLNMRSHSLMNVYRLTVFFVTVTSIMATHFRGGTISWKSLGGKTVEFFFKMGWTYGSGPGCTEHKIGQYVNDPLLGGAGTAFDWICVEGCKGKPIIHPPSYYCMAANKDEEWEQGQMTFTYTFQNDGPFRIAFEGVDWMPLGNNKGSGPWSISTIVDLRKRSDTNKINTSPVALSQAIYYMQYDCHHVMRIPVLDADGDKVLCHWAVGAECQAVCDALPGAQLDEENCTITFDSTATQKYEIDKFYAVALTIRDYPKTNIKLDGIDQVAPSDNLSSVPIQFLIKTPVFPVGCNEKPRFVVPTPNEGEMLLYQAGDLVNVIVAADNSLDVNKAIVLIDVIGPVGLNQSPLTQDTSRQNTFQKTLTWQTSDSDIGDHIVCAKAQNARGKTGDPRCFTIQITPDPCDSNPCLMGGTCHSSRGNFTCDCVPGFTGRVCEIDIDDCQTDPCQNGGVCHDLVNDYVCTCEPGFTDKNCSTDIDDCLSDPCMHGGNCTDQVNDFTCLCIPGYTGKNCHIGVDFCIPKPCENSGICENSFTDFTCHCVDGWAGKICDYREATSKRSSCTQTKPGVATSLMLGARQKSCCQETEYSDCQCFLAPNVQPQVIGINPATRDLLCALIGFPIGLGLSFITFALMRRCTSGAGAIKNVQSYRAKHPPTKLSTNRTQTWINDHLSPVEASDGNEHPSRRISTASSRPRNSTVGIDGIVLDTAPPPSYSSLSLAPTNIYRASFNDESLHRTASKKNPDTYSGGAADWGNGKLIQGAASRRRSGLVGITGIVSPSPSIGESVTPTNIYRASFNDESMHKTAAKKNPDTYSGGAADWGNNKTPESKDKVSASTESANDTASRRRISDIASPSPSIGESVTPTNIYRASFNDEGMHRTAEKKNLDTYEGGAADWGSGKGNVFALTKPTNDTASRRRKGSAGITDVESPSPSIGKSVSPTNIYRASFNDESMPRTAEKKNSDTYNGGAADWGSGKTPEGKENVSDSTKSTDDTVSRRRSSAGRITDIASPSPSTGESVTPTNIYRASFNDENIHRTAEKKNPGTYSGGAADWGNGKTAEGKENVSDCTKSTNDTASRRQSGSAGIRDIASPSPSTGESTTPTNIYRASFNDESMHKTAEKKNPDTYNGGAADWPGNDTTAEGNGNSPIPQRSTSGSASIVRGNSMGQDEVSDDPTLPTTAGGSHSAPPTNTYRAIIIDENMHGTGEREILDTHADGATDV